MWGPPRGEIGNLKKPTPAIAWLLERHFLLAMDSKTVVLPREVAIHLRGGIVIREVNASAPELTGTARKEREIDRAAIANVSTFLRWCEELAHNWSDEPPTALRSGGLGVRDLKRTAEHLAQPLSPNFSSSPV